jgi:hypothetical protein
MAVVQPVVKKKKKTQGQKIRLAWSRWSRGKNEMTQMNVYIHVHVLI